MATANDIDTTAAVGKFLSRPVVTASTDDQAEQSEETAALIESVAVAFLQKPQASLPLIIRAKNSLRQVVSLDVQFLDFLIDALKDVSNPDTFIDDTSDLVEAQTALVELDRLGSVSEDLPAFERYQSAVDRFLEQQLASSLKRHARGEFERSGLEARQDIFDALTQFDPTHRVMAANLEYLQAAVSDFRSVDLTRKVSLRTIALVRSSLKQLKREADSGIISKMAAAIELMAGSSSLTAISDTDDLLDPVIETGVSPDERTILLEPEPAQATVLSSVGPWDVDPLDTSWLFAVELDAASSDPQAYQLDLPVNPASHDRVYVTSDLGSASATYEIPANGTLYLQVVGSATEEQEIPITPGTRTVAQIIADINAGIADAVCTEFNPGTNRFIIYGASLAITSILVRSNAVMWIAPAPLPINTDPSVGEILGFGINQVSAVKGHFTAESLADAITSRLSSRATVEVVDTQVRITSKLRDPLYSSLIFDGGVVGSIQDTFGFDGTVEALPSYMSLVEDGAGLDPLPLGAFIGSQVTAVEGAVSTGPIRTLNKSLITDIQGTQIYFSSVPLPRGSSSDSGMDVVVRGPMSVAVQDLTQRLKKFIGVFEDDSQDIQQAMVPIMSKPTAAQLGDARRVLEGVKDKLSNGVDGVLDVLDSIVVNPSRSLYHDLSEVLIKSLEERGLDRSVDLLSTGRFSEFFGLSKNAVSRASRFMQAMEGSMTVDIPTSIVEEDIDDDEVPTGERLDEYNMSGANLDDEDELIPDDG